MQLVFGKEAHGRPVPEVIAELKRFCLGPPGDGLVFDTGIGVDQCSAQVQFIAIAVVVCAVQGWAIVGDKRVGLGLQGDIEPRHLIQQKIAED